MADYGDIHTEYSLSFRPDAPRYTYWWSAKSFSGSETVVPKEYLALLLDAITYVNAKAMRQGYAVTLHRVKWDAKRQSFVYPDYINPGEKWTKEWLKKNGYEVNECQHGAEKVYGNGFVMCNLCSTIWKVDGKSNVR